MQQVSISDAMRHRLERSNFIFSGFKAFHELNEAFPSLIDENGERKPFERFLNDVQAIDSTYNKNYLRAEYNFCQASADMAAKWERIEADGDRYNLQYRTQKDEKVRPEHAALDGVTLPPSDPFWESYYPPNGWNCRCTVAQVRKSKYPVTDPEEARARGEEALQKDTRGIFRFNSGKEGKTFPDYNPYTISRCRDCDIAQGKVNLAFVPENELCAACQIVRACAEAQEQRVRDIFIERRKELLTSDEIETRNGTQSYQNLQTSKLLQSRKPLKRLLNHCHTLDELDAAKHLWEHPEQLTFVRQSPMGEGKDLSLPEVQRNIEKKRERGIIHYNVYRLNYLGNSWIVKLEVHRNGFEQPYFIKQE